MSFLLHSKSGAMERPALVSLLQFSRLQLIQLDFYNTNQETLSMDDLGEFATIWKEFDSTAHISLTSTVEEALQVAETFADPEYGLQAFVTGHDRLVGPALSILEPMYQDHV
jgi:hypothetical protein